MTDKPTKIDPKGANVKAYGAWVLVRFDPKPTHSAGGLHLPLSQQVEEDFATCVSVGHLVKEKMAPGDRLCVKRHMNGQPLDGTDCHWLTEESVLGVVT